MAGNTGHAIRLVNKERRMMTATGSRETNTMHRLRVTPRFYIGRAWLTSAEHTMVGEG